LTLLLLAACRPEITDTGTATPVFIRGALDTSAVDFGYVPTGESAEASLELTSIGSGTLTIDALTISNPAFTLEDSYPPSLEPGESATLTLHFTPTEPIVYTGTLEVVSDDRLPLSAELQGSADPTPIAVCETLEPHVLIGAAAYFFGDRSASPTGDTLTWSWSLLSAPAGSVATLAASGAEASLVADVLGEFVVGLTVTDTTGRSSACTTSVSATEVPFVPGLSIELTWEHEGDDFDLHLVRDDGELLSSNDCYFYNCLGGLDWGVRGDYTDNPDMLQDDITGTGPEQIALESPADARYTLYVHDYPNSVYNGANPALVRVFWDNVLLAERTVNPEEDDYIPVFVFITADRSITEP
jgi:hypothetical protein